MRARATALSAAAAAFLLGLPATPANAVTTTSEIVVYTADTNGNGIAEIYRRPADGSGSPVRLFYNTARVRLPQLSPDGTKLAYLQNDTIVNDQRVYSLYVRTISPTVGGATKLLDLDVTGSVSWSRDGSSIVASAVNWSTFAFGTWIVPVAGGSPTLVPTTDKTYGEEPSFSPSGEQVAVDAFDSHGDYTGIDLITLSTGKRARIAGTSGYGSSDPQWSPDGQYVLFQRWLKDGCGIGLYRVPSGGGTASIVREKADWFLGSAEYARDGSQIFFGQSPMPDECGSSGQGDIWVSNPDGSAAVNLTTTTQVYEYGSTVAGGTLASDTTAPEAPVIDPVGALTATTATIRWTAAPDATDFVVLRKAHGDPAPTSMSDGTLVYHGPARVATATGLTTGTAYDLYVFATDASGNDSPVSLAHAVRPTPVPGVVPTVRVGIGTTNNTFDVHWTGSADTYQLLVGENKRSSSGVWTTSPVYTTAVASTTQTVAPFTGSAGHTYYFKARGFDEFGNATPYPAPVLAHVPVDDNWSGFAYSTGWVAKSESTVHYAFGYHTTITRGASVKTRVDTSRFTVVGDTCATCGTFAVYVDGVYKGTFDSYSSTTRNRQVLYASGVFSAIRSHSIEVVALGTSGRPRVSFDELILRR